MLWLFGMWWRLGWLVLMVCLLIFILIFISGCVCGVSWIWCWLMNCWCFWLFWWYWRCWVIWCLWSFIISGLVCLGWLNVVWLIMMCVNVFGCLMWCLIRLWLVLNIFVGGLLCYNGGCVIVLCVVYVVVCLVFVSMSCFVWCVVIVVYLLWFFFVDGGNVCCCVFFVVSYDIMNLNCLWFVSVLLMFVLFICYVVYLLCLMNCWYVLCEVMKVYKFV